MIAIDTSSMIAYLSGDNGSDVVYVGQALEQHQAVFPPVVLVELLSDPLLTSSTKNLFQEIPLLDPQPLFWQRGGLLRAKIISKGFKARLADTLIAQSCLDHHVSLITRDRDFRHFKNFGLKLLV